MRLALLLVAACGGASQPTPGAVGNHASPTLAVPPQRLDVKILEELGDCPKEHPLTLSLDGAPLQTMAISCPPPPPPPPPGSVVVTESHNFHYIDGKPIDIPPGHHILKITDATSGLSDEEIVDFPLTFEDEFSMPAKGPPHPIDIALVIVHVDWVQLRLTTKQFVAW